jgi:hypothetical protein
MTDRNRHRERSEHDPMGDFRYHQISTMGESDVHIEYATVPMLSSIPKIGHEPIRDGNFMRIVHDDLSVAFDEKQIEHGREAARIISQDGAVNEKPESRWDELQRIASNIADLVHTKGLAYGHSADKTGRILAIMYPNGIPVEVYADAQLIVRILDKLCRITNGTNGAMGEDAWTDIAGYCFVKLSPTA